MAQSQFENSANQQAVPEGPRPITISDRDALHFPFAFSPAPADADSRIAFSRSVGVDSRARLDSLTGPFLSWRKARPIKPNATRMAPAIIIQWGYSQSNSRCSIWRA